MDDGPKGQLIECVGCENRPNWKIARSLRQFPCFLAGRTQTSAYVIWILVRANIFPVGPTRLAVAEPLRQSNEATVIHKP
jgi:hypothetical protein